MRNCRTASAATTTSRHTDSTASGVLDVPGLMYSDGMGSVPEFQARATTSPRPSCPCRWCAADLQVTSLLAQGPDPIQIDHVLMGQSFTVTYQVTNTGAGPTPDRQGKWDDYIYLSRDQFLSDADIYLGAATHTGGLAAGARLSDQLDVQGAENLTGPWYVFVLTDPPTANSSVTGVVFEADKESNQCKTRLRRRC